MAIGIAFGKRRRAFRTIGIRLDSALSALNLIVQNPGRDAIELNQVSNTDNATPVS